MNSNSTIVTALYDIGREKIDGRSMDNYLEWFSKTLLFNCPMVIYCDESLNSFISKHRPEHLLTKIINKKLEEIPYFYLKDQIDKVILSDEYKNRIKDSNRIECKTSLYSIIQYSKFPWVLYAAEQNFFNSHYFFWLDAGASRFVPDIEISTSVFPGERFLSKIKNYPGKSLFQMYVASYPDLAFHDGELPQDYLFDNRSFVWGGMFGVDIEGIKNISLLVEDIFVKDMIENNNINNEQIAIGYLLKKFPQNFALLNNDYHYHRNFELMYQAFL